MSSFKVFQIIKLSITKCSITLALIFPLFGYSQVLPGAYNTAEYLPLLKDKKVALVANQTSEINGIHLLDTLLSQGILIKKIFCPEHGFRGTVDAGEKVKNETDSKTGIKIISLYGRHYKPRAHELKDIDIVIFDIQDVGVRFYTYISTLHYVMEACGENKKTLIVLDRPNPNGYYIDGPVMQKKYSSFVGLHPVPIVYGMTIGEYAKMINGEHWLKDSIQCNLIVIPCKNYGHTSRYKLPVKPSPNLPTSQAILLYPSLALFEGTSINVGRGTNFPFEVFGSPYFKNYEFTYTPKPKTGVSKPMHQDTLCYGINLQNFQFTDSTNAFTLKWLIEAYRNYPDKSKFFNVYFYYLVGNKELKSQIEQGINEKEIKKGWKKDLENFSQIRAKYLIYK